MPDKDGSYDVIVVGGGSAGCVIASRLTEDSDTRVLLLEAGSARPMPEMAVPPAWPSLLQSSASWGESTVVQSATGTSAPLPRGRALGGSSTINAMVFTRGHHSSYEAWIEAGAKGWGFEDLLPYFKRCESTTGRDPALRGENGPLRVSPAAQRHPILAACLDAAAECGHRRADDISGGMEEGFGWTDLNIVDGKRQSAADAYITPVLDRPNLDVVTEARVHRLLIDHGRCTGVEYSEDGSGGGSAERISVRCSREVVLSAGTIGTAQLLMLSGIGPVAHLRDAGIDVLLDLPGVGANLQDHPITNIVYGARRRVPEPQNNHGEAFGLVRSGPELTTPDLQILFIDAPGHLPEVGLPSEGTTLGPSEKPEQEPATPMQGYTIGSGLMRPRSRGTVRLSSTDPGGSPVLDPNYFGDEDDVRAMISGLRMAREIGESDALDDWRGEEAGPGPDVTSDAGLRTYIQATLASYCHPVGTCRIGQDDMSVVDSDLYVHGINGLRIVDGSVLPSLPAGNTNATVYAIAERAAEMLRP